MIVRPVTPADRAQWEALFQAYAAFYKTTVPPTAMSAVWAWIFAENPDFWCDLAEVEGRLVGLVQYQLMQRSLSGQKVCYLSDLFVQPDVRGGGVGR